MVCYHCKLVLLQSFPLIFVSFLYWETIYSFVGDKKLKEVHIKLLLICYLPRFGRASQMEPRASSIDHFHHLHPYIFKWPCLIKGQEWRWIIIYFHWFSTGILVNGQFSWKWKKKIAQYMIWRISEVNVMLKQLKGSDLPQLLDEVA